MKTTLKRTNGAIIAESDEKSQMQLLSENKANLREANLREANLREANLREANLREANLREANLREANLSEANLSEANLSGANLSGANLRGANLSEANLRKANLSGCIGLIAASAFLSTFARDDIGIHVYRARYGNHLHPAHWEFEAGKFLTETPNPDRCTECGCGVAFATLKWVQENHAGEIWKCRIQWLDLADVVVPFGTDGKARCARLELLEVVR